MTYVIAAILNSGPVDVQVVGGGGGRNRLCRNALGVPARGLRGIRSKRREQRREGFLGHHAGEPPPQNRNRVGGYRFPVHFPGEERSAPGVFERVARGMQDMLATETPNEIGGIGVGDSHPRGERYRVGIGERVERGPFEISRCDHQWRPGCQRKAIHVSSCGDWGDQVISGVRDDQCIKRVDDQAPQRCAGVQESTPDLARTVAVD